MPPRLRLRRPHTAALHARRCQRAGEACRSGMGAGAGVSVADPESPQHNAALYY